MQDTRLHPNVPLGTLNKSGTSSVNVANFNRDDDGQMGRIISQYVNLSDNKVLDRLYYSEPAGTPFTYDISTLKSHVPNGFIWGGISSKNANIASYKPGVQFFNVMVYPVPKPQLSQIIVRYVQPKNGGIMMSDKDTQHSELGFRGDIFNLSSVKQNVPRGYQLDLDPSDYKPADFKGFRYIKAPLIADRNPYVKDRNGKMVIRFKSTVQLFEVGVKPIREAAQMSIIYLDSADPLHPIKKISRTRDVGMPFHIAPYEVVPYVSSDYRVVGTPQNVPAKYVRNAKPIIINVVQKLAKMIIKYVYIDNKGTTHLVKSLSLTGKQGSAFHVGKYSGAPYLPPYYQSKDIVDNSIMWLNHHQITIHVVPQKVTMPVVYQLPNGKQIGNTDKITGTYNTRFDPARYEYLLIDNDKMPRNYQVVGHSVLPKTYQPNRLITFIVEPLDIIKSALASAVKSNAETGAGQSAMPLQNHLNKNSSSSHNSSTNLKNSVMNSIMSSLASRCVSTAPADNVASDLVSESANAKSNNAGDNDQNHRKLSRTDKSIDHTRYLVENLFTLSHRLNSLVRDYNCNK